MHHCQPLQSPGTIYSNTSSYYSDYHADYWHVFSLDRLMDLQIGQEFFLSLHEDLEISEIYIHWRECANENPINPQYEVGLTKNGMRVSNGFCRSAPEEKSVYDFVHSLSGSAIGSTVYGRPKLYEYEVLRSPYGVFTSQAQAEDCCSSVGMRLASAAAIDTELSDVIISVAENCIGDNECRTTWLGGGSSNAIQPVLSDIGQLLAGTTSGNFSEFQCCITVSNPIIDCEFFHSCSNLDSDFVCMEFDDCDPSTLNPPVSGIFGCEDIDNCLTLDFNCNSSAICANSDYGYTCECPDFDHEYPTIDGTSCEDIDECEYGTHNCLGEATCENRNWQEKPDRNDRIPGEDDYKCKCPASLVVETGEIYNNTVLEQVGENYVCTPCPCGYESPLEWDELGTVNDCVLIDPPVNCFECPPDMGMECQKPNVTHPLVGSMTDCWDEADCVQSCANFTCPYCGANEHCGLVTESYGDTTVIVAKCVCDHGYELINGKCIDINECLEPLVYNVTCPTEYPAGETICINSPGSYVCVCPDGYYYNELTGTCEDYNECTC